MSESAVVVPLQIPIQTIGNRIAAGYQRAQRGGVEWIEGSIEAAVALLEARERFGTSDKEFGAWLKDQQMRGSFHYGQTDRAALIRMAHDPARMREALTKSTSRSYEMIWREVRSSWPEDMFPKNRKDKKAETKTKRTPMTELRRQVKLEGIYERIADTSLGSKPEMDALIALIDADRDEAEALIERAIKGDAVSAVAACKEKDREPRANDAELISVWIKHSHRLLAAWLRANEADQDAFIRYLQDHRHG